MVNGVTWCLLLLETVSAHLVNDACTIQNEDRLMVETTYMSFACRTTTLVDSVLSFEQDLLKKIAYGTTLVTDCSYNSDIQ